MSQAIKAEVTKRKNVRGRVVAHVGSIGPISVDGKDAKDAGERAVSETFDALKRLDQGMYIKRFRGHVAVVAPTCWGWRYWIDTFSDDYSQDCGDVATGGSNRNEAMARALHHLAQNVWNHEVTDDRKFVEELPEQVAQDILRGIAWQRHYRVLTTQGMSHEEAHRNAERDERWLREPTAECGDVDGTSEAEAYSEALHHVGPV